MTGVEYTGLGIKSVGLAVGLHVDVGLSGILNPDDLRALLARLLLRALSLLKQNVKYFFLKISKLNSPRSVLFYCVLVPCQMVHGPLPLFKCPSSLWNMFALHGMCRAHPHPVAVHVAKSVFTPQIGLSCEKMNTCPCDFRYDKWHCCRVLTRSLPVTDSLTCEKVWQTSKQLTLNPLGIASPCVYLNCGKKRCWATVKCKLH